MALLGDGWADSSLGEFKKALVPWTRAAQAQSPRLGRAGGLSHGAVCVQSARVRAGRRRNTTAPPSIPSTPSQSASTSRSSRSGAGDLLDRLLNDDKKDTLTWYWQLKTLPDAPESRYLYHLLATNEFQEGLKNYRELKFMSKNLDDWRESVWPPTTACSIRASTPTTRRFPRPTR